MLFTNTQQSFKFSSFIKRRQGGKGTKKIPQRTEQKEEKKKHIEKKNKTKTNPDKQHHTGGIFIFTPEAYGVPMRML